MWVHAGLSPRDVLGDVVPNEVFGAAQRILQERAQRSATTDPTRLELRRMIGVN